MLPFQVIRTCTFDQIAEVTLSRPCRATRPWAAFSLHYHDDTFKWTLPAQGLLSQKRQCYREPRLFAHAGVVLEEVSPAGNNTLIQFQQDNITFESVQFTNIDAWENLYILGVTGSNITFKGFASTGCNTGESILYISGYNHCGNASTTVTSSSFSNCTCEAITIVDCNTYVTNSTFDSLSPGDYDGAAIYVNNSNGATFYAADCNFTNNAVGNE